MKKTDMIGYHQAAGGENQPLKQGMNDIEKLREEYQQYCGTIASGGYTTPNYIDWLEQALIRTRQELKEVEKSTCSVVESNGKFFLWRRKPDEVGNTHTTVCELPELSSLRAKTIEENCDKIAELVTVNRSQDYIQALQDAGEKLRSQKGNEK